MYGVIALTAVISGFVGMGIGWWRGIRSKTFETMRTFLEGKREEDRLKDELNKKGREHE